MNKPKYVKTEILKREREAAGYTYEDMATFLGYRSKSTYMYIENGQTVATIPVAAKISQIFSKSIDYFFVTEVQDTHTFAKPTGTDGK